MRVAPKIELHSADRKQLEKYRSARSAPLRLKERAAIILLAADGFENKEIAEQLGEDPGKVGRWRSRFAQLGLPGILKDKTRPGLRIPAFVGHLIRLISDSESDSVRTGNPVHIGHPIRSLSDSDSD